ncbi:hypothetical protein [Muriicola marianensis]|uniref:Fibronectin type-III domain-containing protein n=1 Tax=Muriicola marianensis TaxID=1324801 RepID=A0ABQ1QT98_9FLAO|nr:hypothetical protein [Muriicola marianensis]GGD41212.1 hypothetical protein GCM10011361_05390 [Muriicola marianensis]
MRPLIGFIASLILILASCGKDRDLASLLISPDAASLVFPENLTECYEGTLISATLSEVTLQWNASANTDRYELHISHLINGSKDIYTTENVNFTARIERGVPYSWYVVSLADGSNATATSDTWSFYNAGDAITSYVPFPAEALNPLPGASLSGMSSVNLTWQAADLDDDIVEYDVYFGSSKPPVMFEQDLSTASLTSVPVTSGTTYFWKIVTRDAIGNESDSEVFSFSVN